ncbi:MAG: nucleoside diphosphate kinase regulator [Eubacteriales bacterium]|nr:nucleoside diphosphate kinase regulator [Eubacteriales bacterium]MDD4445750.1 nucleoside diphosphate kinase regulator [Eubacteriales bacterium]
MERNLYINELDHKRLMRLIEDALNGITEQSNSLRSLQVELGQATVVNAEELPRDVVTMRSRVLIMLDDEEKEITLVYPNEANHSTGKISILSPIGTAIIGYREDDVINWLTPGGLKRIRIKKVLYQPEASGDYEL